MRGEREEGGLCCLLSLKMSSPDKFYCMVSVLCEFLTLGFMNK